MHILSAVYTNDVFEKVYMNLGDIFDLLSLINSSVNFIIYCCMSSEYRQTFVLMLFPKKVYR